MAMFLDPCRRSPRARMDGSVLLSVLSENRKRTFLHALSNIIDWRMTDSHADPPAFEPALRLQPPRRLDARAPARLHPCVVEDRRRLFRRKLRRDESQVGLCSARPRRPGKQLACAWREAQARGRTTAWFETVRRAVEGVEEPYFSRGIQRGTRRVYNDRLLIAAFRAVERAHGGEPFGGTE